MADRAEVMKIALQNNVYSLDTIRQAYNEYAKGGNLYGGGGDTDTAKEVAKAGVSMLVPYAGTALDAYDFYNEPSWENAGWLAASLASDVFLAGYGSKAVRAAKMARAASAVADARKAARIESALNRGNTAWKTNMQSARKAGEVADRAAKETVKNTQKALGAYGSGAAVDVVQYNNNTRAYGGLLQAAIEANERNRYAHGGQMGNYYGDGGIVGGLKGIYHFLKQSVGLEESRQDIIERHAKDRYSQHGYIGGTPRESRQKYYNVDRELTDSVNSISQRYGLNPSIVASRMAEEGPIDAAIRDYNNSRVKGKILSETALETSGAHWGLDDLYSRIEDGTIKITTSAPYSYKKQVFKNEKGRITNSVRSPQWWFGIEGTAADLKARRNKLKKNNSWMSDRDLDAAAAMSYNYGEDGVQEFIDKNKRIPKRFYSYIKTK